MKITRADGSVIEGAPEELAQYEAFLQFHAPTHAAPKGDRTPGGAPEHSIVDWEFVSADVAFRALTRIKLGKEMKAILKLVYEGGDKYTSAGVLQEAVGYSPSQFAGLMGSFGRRLVNTPGYVLHSSFFEQEWHDELSCFVYRLPPSVRAAVEKARIVAS